MAMDTRRAGSVGSRLAGLALAFALLISACGTAEQETVQPSGSAAATAGASFGSIECSTEDGTGCAPVSARVDLAEPAFSDPMAVTNPLFPAGEIEQVLLVGFEAGVPLRVEVTLLPEPEAIEWNGTRIETLAVQYLAHLDGRIHEVAIDWYGQADDGSVWYFGEDVFNFADGVVADTAGTWRAGRDCPPAMIMPASPRVGDVYRPENIPGLVFEEVTVVAIGQTVEGPRGPLEGTITVDELHMNMAHEVKTFAPGYGEFLTGAGSDLEAVALAVPMDARSGEPPAELLSLASDAATILRAAADGDWASASAAVGAIGGAWNALQAGELPPRLRTGMTDALTALRSAVDAQEGADARQAAIDVRQAGLDLEMLSQPLAEVEVARIGLWTDQLMLDADAGDVGAVLGDVTTLEWMRDRAAHHLDDADAAAVDDALVELRAAAEAEDLDAVRDAASRLGEMVAGIRLLRPQPAATRLSYRSGSLVRMTVLTRGALLSLVLAVAACSAPISTDAPPQASAPAASATPDVTTEPASSPPPEESAEPAADPLLAYELVDVRSGATFTLAELAAEKPVVLETMAIWCTTCRAQQREVVEAHGIADFHSVGIDVDPNERAEDLADYAVREGFDWPFAMADAQLVQLLTDRYGFGVTNPPSTPTFIVTADGGIRALEFGHVRSADELVAELTSG